jgi:benzoyl-CoA reductase/2-hydroxyglutaryl-CoA dehydratase subunit BcrC/BadD/HgdB
MSEDKRFDFKVVNVVPNPDGSASYEFEYSDEFADFFKETTGKEINEESFQKFMTKAIKESLKEKSDSNTIPLSKILDK